MKKVILGAVLFPLSGPVLSSSLQDQLANFLGVVGLVPKADITERELNINKFSPSPHLRHTGCSSFPVQFDRWSHRPAR